MQIISFMNMKGGVGKTTLAVNVAYTLASVNKKKVLVVDADPQFNATQYLVDDNDYLKHIHDPNKGTIKDVFLPKTDGPISTTVGLSKVSDKTKINLSDIVIPIYRSADGKSKLDVMPSSLDLVVVQHSPRQTENKLKFYLKEKALNYDYVLIDCPPTISIFTEAAILASDGYIVPIRPDSLSIIGLPLLERYISDYTTDFGKKLNQIGLVFSLVRSPTPRAMKDVMDDLRQQRKNAVFTAISNQATSVAESVDVHKPVINFEKAPIKYKKQFMDITAEFLQRTGG